MVDKKHISWPSSTVVVSLIIVLLCLGEFIRVELILKEHVTRIQNLESKVPNIPQEDSTTNHAENVMTTKPDSSRVRIRRNASTSTTLSDLERLQKLHSLLCIVTITDRKCRAGPPGPPGRPGQRGRRGKRGHKGDMGMPGRFGKQGSIGPRGPKGDKGDKGHQGPRGIPGLKGDPGQSISSPHVIISPPSLVVNEGEKAVLHCSSSGNPEPVIGWSKVHGHGFSASNSSQLTGGDNLVISNVTSSDSGVYECQATNILGTAKQIARLTVNFRPRVSLDNGPLFVKEGDNVTLPRCHVIGYPAPNITWSRTSGSLPRDRTIIQRGQLFLMKLQKRDSDIYICKAKNYLGSSVGRVYLVTVIIPVFVNKPPTNLKYIVGYSLSLNCSAKGEPKPRISWGKRDGYLPSGGRSEIREGTLTIRRVEKGDSGVYICSVTSAGVFTVEAATRVNVKTGVDCSEIYKSGERQNGVYTVDPDGRGPFQVYCDMTTDEGGWAVFQRRQDGSVDFYRNWNQYKTGFGNLAGEFWLGNDKIHRMTSRTASMLRVELEDWDRVKVYAKFGSFSVGSEGSKYRLSVSLYSGSAGNSLKGHNGMAFSTNDRDNDVYSGNCATMYTGAWWYRSCHASNLNGKYLGKVNRNQGARWSTFRGDLSLKVTEMKSRPTTI